MFTLETAAMRKMFSCIPCKARVQLPLWEGIQCAQTVPIRRHQGGASVEPEALLRRLREGYLVAHKPAHVLELTCT